MIRIICILIFCVFGKANSQKKYDISSIPENLKTNAISVVRNDKITISIPKQNKLIYSHHIAITVMSKEGNSHVDPYVRYDNSRKVKKLEAILYDENGNEIEKFRKNDFHDMSAVDGGTLYSDNRMKYLVYNPESYPYTIVIDYMIESDNTVFMPKWFLQTNYNSSIENKSLSITYEPSIGLRHKIFDPNQILIINDNVDMFSVTSKNIKSLTAEQYSPDLYKRVPNIVFATNKFHMEGIYGEAKTWKEFGKWKYENLLEGLDKLPEEIVLKISELVKNAETVKEKVKLIYQYVQENTRYISVQLGIGGLRPYPASQVDKLGYGDCKGLSNYTKALLNTQGIKSYYAIVWAGNSPRNIDKDFTSIQGNHVILNVPIENEEIWLECTSQTMPFNFLGDFTDDRDVFLLTKDGGVFKRTPRYSSKENKTKTKASLSINQNGTLQADLEMISSGIQYDRRFVLSQFDSKEQGKSYKNYWDYIDNINFDLIEVSNNRENIVFTEKMRLNARAYARKSRDKLFIPLNAFHRITSIPDITDIRNHAIVLKRGYIYLDEYTINLPKEYKIESIPESINLKTLFGSYKTSVEKISDTEVIFNREFQLNKNTFEPEKYDDFREFMRSIKKGDNQKLITIKVSN